MTLPSPAPIFGPAPRIVVSPEIPSISRVFLHVPVQIVRDGAVVSPGDQGWPVSMAFTAGAETDVSPVTWYAAEWYSEPRANGLAYFARILIGPGGTVLLQPGLWLPWVRYDTGVELPVLPATGPVTII